MAALPSDGAAARRRWGALAVLWAGVLVAWMWHHVLDDAFIHLRYAEQLVRHGYLTYDGVSPSTGTSSPLYVCVLAALSTARVWALWPKAAAVAGYAALAVAVWRRRRDLGVWSAALGVLLAAPMAVRTLTDGMETPWATLAAAGLADLVARRAHDPWRGRDALVVAAVAFVAAWLRLDLLVLVAAAASAATVRREMAVALALASGGALGLGAQVLWSGSLVPDAALAKHLGFVGLAALKRVLSAHGAAISFGAGLLVTWLASWRRLHRTADARTRAAAFVVNLAGPVFWLAVLASGQISHGLRYFVPFYAFAIVWNVSNAPPVDASSLHARRRPWRALAAILAAAWAGELALLAPVVASRTQTLRAFQSLKLERFSGLPSLALDVGQVGYFSNTDVCDVRGLINGPVAARSTFAARIHSCWARRPVLTFLTPEQEAPFPEVRSWPVCAELHMETLRGTSAHRLRVRPDLGCAFTPPPPPPPLPRPPAPR